MAGQIYALLVGINAYSAKVGPLTGCVNDVTEFGAFLEARVDNSALHIEKLLDGDATRDRVIEQFGAHLGQAGTSDVALFYYSGHGSVETVDDDFWYLEPTGLNQTLVCFDSRTKGVPDLADKELSALIDDVAAAGPHVLIVLDCCHSGGGTREVIAPSADVRVRQAPPVEGKRRIETYLPRVREAVEQASKMAGVSSTPGLRDSPAAMTGSSSSWQPRHIALSACESHQLSKELTIDGRPRGVFSAALCDALIGRGSGVTYRDLVAAAAISVRNRVGDQDPIAYATERDDLDRPFLGGDAVVPRSRIMLEHDNRGWWVTAGTMHGIQPPVGTETTRLSVFPVAGDNASPVGSIRVVSAELARSSVEPEGDWSPSPDERYTAVVIEVPLPQAGVELRGDEQDLALVRTRLSTSPHVREVGATEQTGAEPLCVVAESGRFVIARTDGTPMTSPVLVGEEGAERIVGRLEHLAKWHLAKALDNPTSSLAGSVTIEIRPAVRDEQPPKTDERARLEPDDSGDVRLTYARDSAGTLQQPFVWVYVRNNSDRDLYCTLLDFTDRFRCHSKLLPMERINAGQTAVAFNQKPIPVTVPEERLKAGGTVVRDWFKVIASEQRFEPDAFELPNLDGVVVSRGGQRGVRERSTIDRIAAKTQTRDAGDVDDEAGSATLEWTTAIVSVRTERPPDGETIPPKGASVTLNNGETDVVTISGHRGLAAATATLGTSEQATRGLGAQSLVPTRLVLDPDVARPVTFSATRSSEGALDHVVLQGDINAEAVTPDDPLQIRLNLTVDEQEVVLAVAREGDLFLPLGIGTGHGAEVAIDLVRLPDPTAVDGAAAAASTRGLGRSIRIFFQRIVGQRLGVDPGWPRLSLVHVAEQSGGALDLVYDNETDHMRSALDGASRVLLVLHGILGDTHTMVPGLWRTIGDEYDALVAFDFDSIGMTIEESARQLAERLQAVGVVGDGSALRLDVVAHSQGALVARWWIEREGGAALVREAVLSGIPNAGTPWAQFQGWATRGLTLGLNGLTAVAWPAAILGWLVGAIERVDRGIDQLQPDAKVLEELASADGQAAPYTVLVGRGSVRSPLLREGDSGRLSRVMHHFGDATVALAFLRQPNDLVVSEHSMRSLPPALAPTPDFTEVDCDHMTYYERPEALAAVKAALAKR